MKIAFNPSTVAALTAPPNNKDITFDLRGRNIFARGVKFYGTDTNTWRPVVDNLTSDSTTSSLSAKQGKVLKALIDGKSNSGHTHDDRYYTKAESNAKYITDITTSVNKLTFTKNGANINKDITVNQILSKGALPDIADKDNTTKADSGLFIYSSYAQTIGTNLFSSVLSINTGGTIQIAGNWGEGQPRNLYWRSQSDRNVANYPWKSWRTILDNGNSSISGNTITINGNSLTVSKLDHNHDGRYVRKWTGVYGSANKFLKLVISEEKGWIRLEVSDSNNALSGGYGIYIIGWGWHGNNGTDTLTVRCLYANDSRYTTALKVVRTSRDNYDFYFQFASNSSYPSYTINYSSSISSIDCTVTKIATIPTATWTSSLSALQLNASQVDWSGITNKPSTFNPAAHTHTVFRNNLMIKGTNGVSDSSLIHLGIGDSDTGFKWISDGVCQMYANNVAVGQWTSGGMNWFKNPTVNGNKVWNAGNDGSGSGLDADTLDGAHLNGLLTSVSNVNNGISVTVGGTTKSVSNISVNQAVISDVANLLDSHDERINQYYPYEVPRGIRLRFQNENNNGLNSGGYYGLLSWRSYGVGNDLSGGYPFQIAYLQSGDLCTRVGTGAQSWSPWRKLACLDSNVASASRLEGGNIPSWGTLTAANGFTNVSSYDYGSRGAYGLCGKNNALYMQLDGYFYQNEGKYRVIDTSDFNWTNLPGKVVLGNEFNIVNAGYNNNLWFNYLPIDNKDSSATITQYNMGNGNRGLASVYAYRFKADGKPCMWKDARNYAPFYATFNGGFEPILDIKTVSGDWSIGSYDSAGNYLIFSFTSDSDFNAGVNGTAWYYITTDGTFSGASRYINHTPGDPQSYMYSTSTGTYGGAIQIREVNEVLNNQSAWGYAPRITFHWGQRYAKGFGMRSDGQFAVDDVPIALTSNVLTFNNNANYLGANFNNPDFSKKAASTYIECWDGAGGWWNWMAGKFMKAGSSDAYVLLGGGGHKPLSEFQLGNGSYLPYNGWWTDGNGLDVNNSNGMIFAYASHKNSPFSSAWGIITTFDYTYNSGYKFQLAANGYYNAMYYRSRSNDRGGWTSWAQVIDTGNISSQRVAYATSAGSVSNSLNIFGVSYNGSAAKTVTTSTFVSQLPEGTSTVTDGTMFITSWASDSGFADTNAVNVPYKRKASCLWNYIDNKVSSKYLPLAGGTMNGNARIGHGSGNLYIGNSGNDGWVYTQDIASQSGTDKWWVRESGAAHFGNVYICTKSDYTTYDSSIIECYTGNNLYLNYYSPRGVNLCNGGGTVQIGPYTTGDTGNNKLFVNGSEFIQGASNVRDHVFANGFRHRSHNSNDSVLLAGGGYSQGVPVKYWSIETIIIYGPTQVSRTNRGGNYTFVTKVEPRINGSCTLTLQFPSGYNNYNTIIWAMGRLNQEAHDSSNSSIYATIVHLEGSKYYLNLADDESLNNGTCQLYFMCF